MGAALAMVGCGDGRTVWSELAHDAEIARALELAWDVPILEVTPEQYAAMREADVEDIDDDDLATFAATYGRMGFFDPSLDLRPIFASSSSNDVAGVYSSISKRILIVGEPGDDVIVHEVVHALQDQHFRLERFRDVETSDARATRRAVVEGDASLAQGRFLLRSKGAELEDVDWSKLFDGLEQQSATYLEEAPYPVFFAASPAFTYTYGTMYCAHNLTGAHPDHPFAKEDTPFDWSHEDELFTNRTPASTQAILRAGPVPQPVEIGLDDVPESLAGKLTAVDWDTLGAWYTFILLYPTYQTHERPIELSHVAKSWAGDRVLFVKDAATGQIGLVWASSWLDETSAQEAVVRLDNLHGFTPGGDSPWQGTGKGGEPMWIEPRGPHAVFLKNVAPEHTQALVDAALGPLMEPMSATAKPAGRPRSRPSLAAWGERLSRGSHSLALDER